jgi:2-aminoadipate transaminase
MGTSAVREILKVTERPDIISFAGGLPAPELFPVDAFAQAHAEVFAEEGAAALQYSTTEGWLPLREWIAARMRKKGIGAAADRVLITSGSQQGIDLVAKVFLDPGDGVIVESPTYLAALQAFNGMEASLIPVGSDDLGMRVDEVETILSSRTAKLIYLVPDFQNPKGTTLSLERRKRLAAAAKRWGAMILEDDPYGELRFAGDAVPPLAALDDDGVVIYISTFSKTLSPGMRVGWAVASAEVFAALVIAKQPTDLHTSTIGQRATARLLASFDYEAHLSRLKQEYGFRCGVMVDSLEHQFPPGTRWTRPEGGLFLWIELPNGVNDEELLGDAIAEKVAFVPGSAFFAGEPKHNFVRLNFSNSRPEAIEEGIGRLAKALKRRIG